MGLSDVLLLNYNTDIEAYYIILTEVILKNEQRAGVQFHLKRFHTAPTCIFFFASIFDETYCDILRCV